MALYQEDSSGTISPLEGLQQEQVKEISRIMDSADDDQIITSMTGAGSQVLFYRYSIKTNTGAKEVIGLSVEGGFEVANGVRNLEVLSDYKIDKDQDPDYIYAIVRVINKATQNVFLGVGRQCKFVVGQGNTPLRDRLDEHAFVKAVSKAQRNGLLHHADQRMLASLIETWAKGGKGKLLAPAVKTDEKKEQPKQTSPVSTTQGTTQPTTSAATAAIAEQLKQTEERIKQLKIDIHNKMQSELALTDTEAKKAIVRELFKNLTPIPESMSQLSENQLNQLLAEVDRRIVEKNAAVKQQTQPPTQQQAPAATALPFDKLGFSSLDEQTRMRSELATILTKSDMLGLSNNDARKFLLDRGYQKSVDVPKDKLNQIISDASAILAAKNQPTDF